MTQSKCSGCGKPVIWIKTIYGGKMICDPDLVAADGTQKITLVTENGVTYARPHIGIAGYVPHWGTCSHAARFKKKKG